MGTARHEYLVVKSDSKEKLVGRVRRCANSRNDGNTSPATPSNCGNTLKLQLPSCGGNTRSGQVNCLGYGKNAERCKQWAIRSQALTDAIFSFASHCVQFTD